MGASDQWCRSLLAVRQAYSTSIALRDRGVVHQTREAQAWSRKAAQRAGFVSNSPTGDGQFAVFVPLLLG